MDRDSEANRGQKSESFSLIGNEVQWSSRVVLILLQLFLFLSFWSTYTHIVKTISELQ